MKKTLVCMGLALLLLVGVFVPVGAQEMALDFVSTSELVKEQKMLYQAYGVDLDFISKLDIGYSKNPPEEVMKIAVGLIEQSFGVKLPEFKRSETTLGSTIHNTVSMFGDVFREAFTEKWIEMAKNKAEELKNVKQISYTTSFVSSEAHKYRWTSSRLS